MCNMSLGYNGVQVSSIEASRIWRRSSRDVPCRWTGSGEGRTWGLDWGIKMAGKADHGWLTLRGVDRVDLVKIAVDQVNQTCRRTWWSGGWGRRWHVSRSWRRRSEYASPGGSVVWASKPPVDGFLSLVLKTRLEFQWKQEEARGVIVKLASWRARGHRMLGSQVGRPFCPWVKWFSQNI
jgi:hypothetical protein